MPAYATCESCKEKFEVNLEDKIRCPYCGWPENPVKKTRKPQAQLNYRHAAEIAGCYTCNKLLLTLPVPFSNNAEPSHVMAIHKYKQFWGQAAIGAWMKGGSPLFPAVNLYMHFVFPDHRKRDFTNYSGNYSIKGILDGLKGRAFPDDSSQYVTLSGVTFGYDKDRPRLEITLEGKDL